jgi:hypothetical protein
LTESNLCSFAILSAPINPLIQKQFAAVVDPASRLDVENLVEIKRSVNP